MSTHAQRSDHRNNCNTPVRTITPAIVQQIGYTPSYWEINRLITTIIIV